MPKLTYVIEFESIDDDEPINSVLGCELSVIRKEGRSQRVIHRAHVRHFDKACTAAGTLMFRDYHHNGVSEVKKEADNGR